MTGVANENNQQPLQEEEEETSGERIRVSSEDKLVSAAKATANISKGNINPSRHLARIHQLGVDITKVGEDLYEGVLFYADLAVTRFEISNSRGVRFTHQYLADKVIEKVCMLAYSVLAEEESKKSTAAIYFRKEEDRTMIKIEELFGHLVALQLLYDEVQLIVEGTDKNNNNKVFFCRMDKEGEPVDILKQLYGIVPLYIKQGDKASAYVQSCYDKVKVEGYRRTGAGITALDYGFNMSAKTYVGFIE